MSKRAADGGDSGSQPPIKKVQFEPIFIGSISTLEEMDMKVLQFQNKKLAQVSIQNIQKQRTIFNLQRKILPTKCRILT